MWLEEAVPEVRLCLCEPAAETKCAFACSLHRVPVVFSAEQIEKAQAWLHGVTSRKPPSEAASDDGDSQCGECESPVGSAYEGFVGFDFD